MTAHSTPLGHADFRALGLDPKHAQRAVDALKVQDAITKLGKRYDPQLVMSVCRDWLAYMDKQVARNDGNSVDDGSR